MYSTILPLGITGHVNIVDDLGETLLDKDNAVHPQNMARIITRALSNESNYAIHRIAFGNGGTEIDAAFTVTFKTPNDGQPPDTQTWESRLYNETYAEVVDDSNSALLGTDQGSAGPRVGTRAGGGARPENDPGSVEHVSGPGVRSLELGLTSEVVVTAVLNPSEPTGQLAADNSTTSLNSSFTFDEIGLYTSGRQAKNSAGVQDVDVNNKNSTDVTSLVNGNFYSFNLTVDATGTTQLVTLQAPIDNPTYGDLAEALSNPTTGAGLPWSVNNMGPANVSITDNTFGTYPTIEGAQTFGFLRFTSKISGNGSSITLAPGGAGNNSGTSVNDSLDLFSALPGLIIPGTEGSDKGIQNLATSPESEQERLLTHLVFSPVLKAANRTLTITYTLTVSVARTQS